MGDLIDAKDLGHFWMTSKTSPDAWLDKTEGLIGKHGGEVLSRGYGKAGGREAYMLTFRLEGNTFKVVWPVLPTQHAAQAARIQAATLLYHDVKSKIVTAKVFGTRAAFLQYLVLPGGRTAAELADTELTSVLPDLNAPLLLAGDVRGAEHGG